VADILWGIQNDTGSSLTIACINEVAYVIGACDSFLEQDPKKDVLPYWSAFVGLLFFSYLVSIIFTGNTTATNLCKKSFHYLDLTFRLLRNSMWRRCRP